jgi:cholesterol transport system auxiliary component
MSKHIATIVTGTGTLLGLILVIGGCFTLERPSLDKQFYMLEVKAPEAKPSVTGGVLKIQNVEVSPQYAGKAFVYVRDQGIYVSDFYNGFFVAPNAMFTELVRQWLGASGIFGHVIESSSYMEATHILESMVTALYGDFSVSQSPRAVVEMKFLLLKNGSNAPYAIFDKSDRLEISIAGTSPSELVKGWSVATGRILDGFAQDLSQVLD